MLKPEHKFAGADSAGYDRALALFHQWTHSLSLRRHAHAVEAAMERYATLWKQDVILWRITGLLHDMDYEKHPTPEEHPFVGVAHLQSLGYPESVTTAIMGHTMHGHTPRESLMAKTLFACDELAGFITAVALVRPTRMAGMKVKSVRKKLKDKAFAAAVSRLEIAQGARELGIALPEHIANVIAAMQHREARLQLPRAR